MTPWHLGDTVIDRDNIVYVAMREDRTVEVGLAGGHKLIFDADTAAELWAEYKDEDWKESS